MTDPTPFAPRRNVRTEAEAARDADAVAGLALVRARVARCTPDEQTAFWEAVRRCFASAATEEAPAGA